MSASAATQGGTVDRDDFGGDALLSPYRVLDLTDQRGLLCGRILADLGADVIQVEPPGGSAARAIGPFYQDDVACEKSLFWWAYAANRRGVTLNLESADGRRILGNLVRTVDFFVESFAPGYLAGLGLGYRDLRAINPSLVMVSITPFGQSGPFAGFEAVDITGMALGGLMYLTGDADRPPVRVGFPQFYLNGAAAGAAGAMMAHTYRTLTGDGQHVDVSCQQAIAKTLAQGPPTWDLEHEQIKRMGIYRQTGKDMSVRVSWRCKDGYANWVLQGGGPGVAASTRGVLQWMAEEGLADEALDAVAWEELNYGEVPPAVMDRAEPLLERFFASHTRAELAQGSLERRIQLFPLATPEDILANPHLQARGYFTELLHGELGRSVTYPGPFSRIQGGPELSIRKRAPLIGEHNREVYGELLGLGFDELVALKQWAAT